MSCKLEYMKLCIYVPQKVFSFFFLSFFLSFLTDKAKDFIGKGSPSREQQGKGTQENCSATWLEVSGFMVTGLVFGLSLASYLAWPIFGLTQGPSWWHMYLSAKMDSCSNFLKIPYLSTIKLLFSG